MTLTTRGVADNALGREEVHRVWISGATRDAQNLFHIGGSDQWGNITAGTELIRKILHMKDAYGMTFRLLLKSDGTKFGKSEDGAIWLSPKSLAYKAILNLSLVDLMVSSGLFESKSAARRLLKQRGLYLNNSRVDSEGKRIEVADIVDGK